MSLVKGAGGQSLQPISPAAHPDATEEIQQSLSTVSPSSRNEQAMLKASCLKGDGFACAITGIFNRESINPARPLPAGARAMKTECAHILPFSLRKFNKDNAQ